MALGLELTEEATYWRLSVSGELDLSGCSQFRLAVDRILRYRPGSVIVDLGELDYLESSGLGILLSLSRQYSAGEGQLVLVTNEPVNRVMSVAGLTGVFTMASSVREALEARGLDLVVPVGLDQRDERAATGELHATQSATQV